MDELQKIPGSQAWQNRITSVSEVMEMNITQIPGLYFTITLDNDEFVNIIRHHHGNDKELKLSELTQLRIAALAKMAVKQENQKENT